MHGYPTDRRPISTVATNVWLSIGGTSHEVGDQEIKDIGIAVTWNFV